MKHESEDIDATARLPQLDIRILSAAFERIEHSNASGEQSAQNSTPEWQFTDKLAELHDRIATLQAAMREGENRYSRLTERHRTLLHKLEAREAHLAGKQSELNQTQDKLATLEQQLQHLQANATNIKQLIADSELQRRQRDQFILKQAVEIKRLRKLLPQAAFTPRPSKL